MSQAHVRAAAYDAAPSEPMQSALPVHTGPSHTNSNDVSASSGVAVRSADSATAVTSRSKKKRRNDPAIIVSIAALLVLVVALVHVGQRAQVAVLTYELQKESSRLAEVERVNNYLLVEVAKARSLQDVDVQARQRLGMVEPENVRWVSMDNGDPVIEAAEGRSGPGLSIMSGLSQWYYRVRSELGEAL